MGERIQKVLAQLGYGSRREIEGWIRAGRISINGKPSQLGDQVELNDQLTLDGRAVTLAAAGETRVLLMNKAVGDICTRHDPQQRSSVFTRLPKLKQGRWISIGRLDINTSGLLLFTNNGELANRYMHPSYQIEREYAVRVLGEVYNEILINLKKGVELDDSIAKFDTITDAGGTGANHWYHVVLTEGRNREVRRLWEAVGLTVSRLQRIRYGSISLPRSLKPGQYQECSPDTLVELLQHVGLSADTQTSPVKTHKKRKKRKYKHRS